MEQYFNRIEKGIHSLEQVEAFSHKEQSVVVVKVPYHIFVESEQSRFVEVREEYQCQYMLFVTENEGEIYLGFTSNSNEIRAVEFLNYLVSDFGLVRGTASFANGQIADVILKVKMSELEMTEILTYFLYYTHAYFEEYECVEAQEYGVMEKAYIEALPRYTKRKCGWAYVKSLDIAKPGEIIRIKTLENESGMLLVASEDAYVMIGCRGEVYDIKRSKFEKTYETSEERLDVFEKMFDFLPAVERVEKREYVSLDELAYLCYPKTDVAIYAKKLEKRTKVFPVQANREYFYGSPGDYLVTREDDLCDSYIIQADVFEKTYEPIENE